MESFCSKSLSIVSTGEAGSELTQFLDTYASVKKMINGREISVRDIVPESKNELELTSFKAMHDIYIYSRIVTKVFEVTEKHGISEVYDLGVGSGLPTISAKLKVPGSDLLVKGVDIDPIAIEISLRNAKAEGLSSHYELKLDDMLSFLESVETKKPVALISNPPYLPFPKELSKDYVFADGGIDGTKYIKKILRKNLAPGSILGLNFATLSNPRFVIKELEEKFDILHVEYYQVAEGRYTEVPAVKEFLKSSPYAVYEVTQDGKLSWGIVGVVARKK